MTEAVNENNAMWREFRQQGKARADVRADSATYRITALECAGKLVAKWHGDLHVRLTNPLTGTFLDFYPTRGTIVRGNVRQLRIGLDAALKLLGVRE